MVWETLRWFYIFLLRPKWKGWTPRKQPSCSNSFFFFFSCLNSWVKYWAPWLPNIDHGGAPRVVSDHSGVVAPEVKAPSFWSLIRMGSKAPQDYPWSRPPTPTLHQDSVNLRFSWENNLGYSFSLSAVPLAALKLKAKSFHSHGWFSSLSQATT